MKILKWKAFVTALALMISIIFKFHCSLNAQCRLLVLI